MKAYVLDKFLKGKKRDLKLNILFIINVTITDITAGYKTGSVQKIKYERSLWEEHSTDFISYTVQAKGHCGNCIYQGYLACTQQL